MSVQILCGLYVGTSSEDGTRKVRETAMAWATAAEKGNAMVVIDKRPEQSVRSGLETELRVERNGISFHDLPGDKVRILVRVDNVGARRSPRTIMRLQSAPLGAFVLWRPLTQLAVPPIEPGESLELSSDVLRPHPTPLGDFDRVPPKKLLTAINSPDESSPSNNQRSAMLNRFWRGQTVLAPGQDLIGKKLLAPDLWDLLGRPQVNWAGNINVFVGRQRVERHCAKALRIYPGCTNVAIFSVGGPHAPGPFGFELKGLGQEWQAVLYNMIDQSSLAVGPSDVPVGEAQWVESIGGLAMLLAMQPPTDCTSGNLEVHVTRRASGQTAVVEFNLDAAAAGPGCYFM